MESKYKITIPEPCHEDWNKMTPDETGRFCNSCVKSVVDFTQMKAPEIEQYFIQNQGKKICGRFNNEQLDSVIIQIPREILFSQVQFYKIFMLALLISMPGLVSSQNTNGTKQKIDKVEIVDSHKEEQLVGKVKLKNPRKETIQERKARLDELKKKREALKQCQINKIEGTTKGDVAIVKNGVVSVEPYEGKPVVADKDTVYMVSTVDVQPEYFGGLTKFYDYFNSNFKLPEQYKSITGKVIVSFTIDSDGNLTDIKVLRGMSETLDKEVLRVLKSSPKWIPGEQNGEKVKVAYSLPIKITAQ